MSLLTSIEKWFARPYNEDGSVLDWFLFLGLLLLIGWIWSTIIRGYKAL